MRSGKILIIILAMIAGVGCGYVIHSYYDAATAKDVAGYINLVSTIFLRLIKMIIAPLVLTTLVVGIAHIGESSSIGWIFAKTMGWFLLASLVSLTLGLVMVTLLQPGVGYPGALPDASASSGLKTTAFTIKDFVEHLVPKSLAESMANNEILQIVVFSMFLGVALASMGKRSKAITEVFEEGAHAMLKITGYVMVLAPFAVFASITATVAVNGLDILYTFAKFMGSFYISLFALWILLFLAGFLVLGPRMFRLLALVWEPFLLAFSTASSEAAYPKVLERLEQFGVSNRIASFVLPMGYSFNLDGSMMYCTFATMFIAQLYGINIPLETQIIMCLVLMITSKGIAGVPRASLVVIAATLNQFHIPEAGLLLIIGIDQFLDMGRSATNVIGNSLAAAVIAKSEGQLHAEQPGIDEGKSLEDAFDAAAAARPARSSI